MRSRFFTISCVVYAIVVLAFSIWWVGSFERYTKAEGTELYILARNLCLICYVFYFTLQFREKPINWLLMMGVPLAIMVLTVVLELLLMILPQLEPSPMAYLIGYGAMYGLFTILAAVYLWR